jgi:DNA-binding MarR family transcriptional regulator
MLKQAHLRNVAFQRLGVKRVKGMTPARFNLLYLLRRAMLLRGPETEPCAAARSQTGLCRDLGLHRSTVSKMLTRLEEMGWVRRERDASDRRRFNVELTEKGLRKIWQAMRRVFRGKVMRRAYERLFGVPPAQPWDEFEATYDPVAAAARARALKRIEATEGKTVVHVIHDVYCTLQEIARYFGDQSAVWYDLGAGLPPRCNYEPVGLGTDAAA